ncbi:30S ribosomal protein S5 alanine N-acetyltransferase [Vibrio albus]|uniref:30S ribosomal protein S5 alanine N-acetyltransferase n=1 Tax=Vibrio albus TaxID=2200953 RepID=A0A2U3BD87_9VIBR|nr:GNAT family N-acetyltransferase [Vibrio albus]PWI34769.1 30S ribosomal protein S5 alanine N-acetyltransferase [Vibrio albus]
MWRELTFKAMNETEGNIQVRLARTEDAGLISDYFLRNKTYLEPWEPKRENEFYTFEGWRRKLIKLNELHLMELGFYCLIFNTTTNTLLGTISFSNLNRFPQHSCSVGYSLDENMQGRGIMRTALRLACNWMFNVQNMHRITASYMPHNRKSEAVLEASGFQKEGFAKGYLLINGQWEDHNMTALINQSWQERA